MIQFHIKRFFMFLLLLIMLISLLLFNRIVKLLLILSFPHLLTYLNLKDSPTLFLAFYRLITPFLNVELQLMSRI